MNILTIREISSYKYQERIQSAERDGYKILNCGMEIDEHDCSNWWCIMFV